MPRIQRSAIVSRPAARLFELVADIERYPQRFDWCTAAEVVAREDESIIARMTLKVGGMQAEFSTRNRHRPGERIDMQLTEGPFRALSGAWTFRALGEQGCKVGLELDFEIAGRYIGTALASGFRRVADRMVDDFVREALAD